IADLDGTRLGHGQRIPLSRIRSSLSWSSRLGDSVPKPIFGSQHQGLQRGIKFAFEREVGPKFQSERHIAREEVVQADLKRSTSRATRFAVGAGSSLKVVESAEHADVRNPPQHVYFVSDSGGGRKNLGGQVDIAGISRPGKLHFRIEHVGETVGPVKSER